MLRDPLEAVFSPWEDDYLGGTVTPLTAAQRACLRAFDVECGTPAGYLAHRRLHEAACDSCLWAWDDCPGIPSVDRDTCGTNDGWRSHRRRAELACDRCAKARLEYRLSHCGTLKGWMLHRRADEYPCGRCNTAQRTYERERRNRAHPLQP